MPAPNDNPEVRLVELAVQGDRQVQRELFERHRNTAYRVALRITGRNEDALDVVQDSFIRAFERLGDFQRESGFQTWLLRIVSNRALDVLRGRKVRLAIPIDTGSDEETPQLAIPVNAELPAEALQRRELGERLRLAIDSLPADQKAVFSLYATGEITYGGIAEILGIPIGTVMSRLYHARRRLHEMLPDLAPGSGAAENT